MYKILKDFTGFEWGVLLVKNGLNIPNDPANTDYQAYLAWLEEGNEPLPAEE